MRYFPAFLDLDGALVLVVGGGEAAAQKLRLLMRTPATIRVVAEQVCAEIARLAQHGRLELARRPLRPRDLDGARLAVAAGLDDATLTTLVASARALNVPLNVVDRPDLSTFIVPSIVDRDPVVVAIGTEGTAPVLARNIKALLEPLLPAALGRLARFAADWRAAVARRLPDGRARRAFWEWLLAGPVAEQVLAGDLGAAQAAAERALAGAAGTPAGRVALVGAGPGDPDLLTFKALRRLQEADVIVVDRLVPKAILDRARRDARRIEVGKAPGGRGTPQAEIDAVLVREALAGNRVVRLKGGDPLVLGRAAEEIAALQAAGIAWEVVPGITAALGCAAVVGLPLTERGTRRGLTLLTGQTHHGPAEHDWAALARPGQTLAIYMGVGAAAHLQERLLGAGIDPLTPVTIVENGTLPEQRLATGAIGNLVETVIDGGIKGPAVIFVGAHPLRRPAARPAAAPRPAPAHPALAEAA